MSRKSIHKIKVIQTSDPAEFERQYNEALDDLEADEYTAEVQPFSGQHVAYIYYKQVKEYFKYVSDEYHAQGIHFLCNQCSLHDPQEDGRQQHVYCKYADCGMTHLKKEACEMFYKKVKQNEITPLY